MFFRRKSKQNSWILPWCEQSSFDISHISTSDLFSSENRNLPSQNLTWSSIYLISNFCPFRFEHLFHFQFLPSQIWTWNVIWWIFIFYPFRFQHVYFNGIIFENTVSDGPIMHFHAPQRVYQLFIRKGSASSVVGVVKRCSEQCDSETQGEEMPAS